MRRIVFYLGLVGVLLLLPARNSYYGSDPFLGPVDAQSILENGSIYLDEYLKRDAIEYKNLFHIIQLPDGHFINKYPDGVSLLQVPFVAIARYVFGMDMTRIRDNKRFQKVMAILIYLLLFWIFYRISLHFLDERIGAIVSFLFIWGSSIVGSNTLALWSHLFMILFASAVLWQIVRYEYGKGFNPYLMGIMLFLVFFVRPTGALFIISVFIYLLLKVRDLKVILKVALISFLLLLAFFGYNYLVYGSILEPYYMSGTEFLGYGLRNAYCMMTSPSRGLLPFNPFLIVVLPAVVFVWKRLPREIAISLTVWIASLVLFIAFFWRIWWGGWAYGPRLLSELMPGFFILTLLVLKHYRRMLGWFIALAIAGFFINSINGLQNPYTFIPWHRIVDSAPDEVKPWFYCSWDANQILASPYTNEMMRMRIERLKGEAGK